ncbi:hypothetical protein [Aggregatilinea lenta]|uniref:hypothetical protein n=1 Tax=Aggregatilinea lenta TaxID=913108 RepID=UPI000E5BA66F|nr:hypothetical protein [Aggregatilinea lenta]
MAEVIMIDSSADLLRGCLVCGAYVWDCTVDGCQPRGQNRPGDVIHCKICNTAYVVEGEPAPRPARRV